MAKFIKKSKKEIGLPPDAIFFRGEQKIDHVLLRIIDFDANDLIESTLKEVEEAIHFNDKNSVTWLNIDGLHNEAIIDKIGTSFNLDTLLLASVMDTGSRPKVQEFDNSICISLKMLKLEEPSHQVDVENISIIITKRMLITFQESKGDVFEPVRDRIRTQKKRIRNSGTDYLAFALLDIVIDNYIYIISEFGEKIEAIEDKLLSHPDQSVIEEINAFKKELNFLRKNINPTKEMILALTKTETDLIKHKTEIHYKELLDNINHAVESTDNLRDILTDQLNIYHTTISTKLNDIMKFLTVFSVIFIPLTFIAGIYGTNFDVVPELHYKYSYFIMWAVFIVIVIAMLLYFKRRKWL